MVTGLRTPGIASPLQEPYLTRSNKDSPDQQFVVTYGIGIERWRRTDNLKITTQSMGAFSDFSGVLNKHEQRKAFTFWGISPILYCSTCTTPQLYHNPFFIAFTQHTEVFSFPRRRRAAYLAHPFLSRLILSLQFTCVILLSELVSILPPSGL